MLERMLPAHITCLSLRPPAPQLSIRTPSCEDWKESRVEAPGAWFLQELLLPMSLSALALSPGSGPASSPSKLLGVPVTPLPPIPKSCPSPVHPSKFQCVAKWHVRPSRPHSTLSTLLPSLPSRGVVLTHGLGSPAWLKGGTPWILPHIREPQGLFLLPNWFVLSPTQPDLHSPVLPIHLLPQWIFQSSSLMV